MIVQCDGSCARSSYSEAFWRSWSAASNSERDADLQPLNRQAVVAMAVVFPWALANLLMTCVFPTAKRQIKAALQSCVYSSYRTVIISPYSPAEAAAKLARTFENIGSMSDFAKIVLVVGHGSRTVNNPFDAAHNCGACGGREGGPNARLFAFHANSSEVRQILKDQYKINIPDDTWFVGGFHDTSSDLVELFDVDLVPEHHRQSFCAVEKILYQARGRNALVWYAIEKSHVLHLAPLLRSRWANSLVLVQERCSKFLLSSAETPEGALSHVHTRSTDLGEARPELGHATNASVIIGRRELTQGLFLARRAFCPVRSKFPFVYNYSRMMAVHIRHLRV